MWVSLVLTYCERTDLDCGYCFDDAEKDETKPTGFMEELGKLCIFFAEMNGQRFNSFYFSLKQFCFVILSALWVLLMKVEWLSS